MKLLRSSNPTRVVGVVLLLCAWLIATNHCALGLMNGANPNEHAHCPGHDSPNKGGDSEGSPLPCCKSIHATPPPIATLTISPAKMLFALPFFAIAIRSSSQVERPLPSEALETGPPFSLSFAESVLQRSLLGHAPPLA